MPNDSPLVSIVMNCFNSDKFLSEALDSIYEQTYDNWEIIFWDNGSKDNSASIAKNYDQRLKYFYTSNTVPLGTARNLALKEAKGDFIAFLDCDDLYLPDKVAIQVSQMQSSGAKLSYGGYIKINENGQELKTYKFAAEFDDKFIKLYGRYTVPFLTLMVDNHYLKANNINFDENLKFAADADLVLRIAYFVPVMSVDSILARYRIHSSSLSHNRHEDKFSDKSITKATLESMGAKEKYKDFDYLSERSLIHMNLIDSIQSHNFKNTCMYSIFYMRLFLKNY